MELNSKTAIISGASRGSGAAFAKALTAKGATVYGLARHKDALTHLGEALGPNFVPVVLDVSRQKEVETWAKKTFAEKIPDILINNAGTGRFGKVDELSAEHWRQMIDTNLNAVYYLTAAIVPFMKKSGSAKHIVNIGSILGQTTNAEKSGYSASKFAIQGFSEALFKELRAFNIKVSCINPGSIDTDFFSTSGIVANASMLQPSDLASVLVNVLETPDNVLIDSLTVRPLKPKG